MRVSQVLSKNNKGHKVGGQPFLCSGSSSPGNHDAVQRVGLVRHADPRVPEPAVRHRGAGRAAARGRNPAAWGLLILPAVEVGCLRGRNPGVAGPPPPAARPEGHWSQGTEAPAALGQLGRELSRRLSLLG